MDIYHAKRDTGLKVESDIIKLAIKTLAENKSTLVAKFIVQNPTLKAEEIEIVQQFSRGDIIFSVRKKHE